MKTALWALGFLSMGIAVMALFRSMIEYLKARRIRQLCDGDCVAATIKDVGRMAREDLLTYYILYTYMAADGIRQTARSIMEHAQAPRCKIGDEMIIRIDAAGTKAIEESAFRRIISDSYLWCLVMVFASVGSAFIIRKYIQLP